MVPVRQKKTELLLVDTAILQPVESHVHRFSMFRLDSTVDNTFDGGVFCLDGCRGLFVPHFLQNVADFNSFACVEGECSEFSFSSKGHYCFDDLRDGEDGPIVG